MLAAITAAAEITPSGTAAGIYISENSSYSDFNKTILSVMDMIYDTTIQDSKTICPIMTYAHKYLQK